MMKNKFNYSEASLDDFKRSIDTFGWIVYENVLKPELLNHVIDSLDDAYNLRRQIQIENGIGNNTDGTLHHLLDKDNYALEFLDQMYFDEEMKLFFKGNYHLNAFGGVINNKGLSTYVQKIHRDIRSFTGEVKMMLQMIVMLDDFTLENGATYFLSGSHKKDICPDEQYFYDNADRGVASKGSIMLFDSHLWHAAGTNYTDQQRRALTLSFTRPYLKQQFDYPRFLGYDYGEALNERLRQVIGYNARVPANLYEYYQPPHKRMYQPGQG